MSDNTQQTVISGKAGPGGGRGRAGMAIVLLLAVGAGAVWWFVLSPQVRIRKAVHEMAAALEQKDADALMAHFSENYSDPAGNTFEDMDHAVRDLALPLLEDVEVEISSVRVKQEQGGLAVAAVYGKITYKIKGIPQKETYDKDKPAVLTFQRENGPWRVVSLENVGDRISDLESSYNDIQDML